MMISTLIISFATLCSICSSSNSNNDDLLRRLIEGGTSIKYDQYPFMAELRYGGGHLCGGSIIRKEYPTLILTAAHCLPNGVEWVKQNMFIRLGADSHTQTVEENPSIIDSNITNVIIHEDWSSFQFTHADIAILSLESKDIEKSPLFHQVKLSSANTQHLSEPQTFTVTGYGRDSCGGPLTQTLESLDVSYVTDEDCNSKLEMHSTFQIPWNSSLCTHSDNTETPGVESTHKGDSGSPLFEYHGPDPFNHDFVSEYKQIGLNSAGICSGPGMFYDVWTDIGVFRSWIETKIIEITKDLCDVGDLSGNCIANGDVISYKQYCNPSDPGYRIYASWLFTSDCSDDEWWEIGLSLNIYDPICCPVVNFV